MSLTYSCPGKMTVDLDTDKKVQEVMENETKKVKKSSSKVH